MKKLIGFIAIITILLGVFFINKSLSSDKVEILKNEINDKEYIKSEINVDTLYNYSDSKVLNGLYENIAIVKIEKIEGVSNYQEEDKRYILPFTYGKAIVIANLKGNIEDDFNFRRFGGELPFDQWIKGQPKASQEKHIRLQEGKDTSDIIVKSFVKGNIDIEEGKTYLVFLINKSEKLYIIGAMQYGLREVENPDLIDPNNLKDIKVLNNETGKYELITEVVNID